MNVTDSLNKMIRVPDNFRYSTISHCKITINFKGALFDFFSNNDTGILDFLNLDFNEIKLVVGLKKLNMGHQQRMETFRESHTIKTPDGQEKVEYITVNKMVLSNFFESTDFSAINCKIGYAPKDADVYVVTLREWVEKFNLKDPPQKNQITKDVIQKLAYLKKSTGENPMNVILNERAYVILYVRNGVISFDYIFPSSIYIDRNRVNSQIQ
jgi:hypothetical protein